MTLNRSFLLAGLALPLIIAGASLADPAPPPAPAPPHEMRMRTMDPAAMAEKHAQYLRDVLQLRPDQEGALKALVESMKPPSGMAEHMGKGPDEDAGLTTPQRLDRMLAHMDEARAMMARHAEAVKRFYAQLSPGQQKAFDALHQGGMGPGMHMRMRMRGPGMHGMPGHEMGMGDMDEMDDMGSPEVDKRVIIIRRGDRDGPDAPAGAPPG
jgi:protein CpxP